MVETVEWALSPRRSRAAIAHEAAHPKRGRPPGDCGPGRTEARPCCETPGGSLPGGPGTRRGEPVRSVPRGQRQHPASHAAAKPGELPCEWSHQGRTDAGDAPGKSVQDGRIGPRGSAPALPRGHGREQPLQRGPRLPRRAEVDARVEVAAVAAQFHGPGEVVDRAKLRLRDRGGESAARHLAQLDDSTNVLPSGSRKTA